ncbi:hypothetical protein H6G06_18070 [Anabaena sphaerica FACHB-251]|uniref:Uncharacterized protein n=1 Tax=Anabaena sphaerica FACHB-251 TaxID=2692883 RepID=A0A927A355_9NOST|nr:hypothetical protein [Anabaena sphaerica]MBD2295325.1 hypothetical protein [Anabaena sphaerica FACHB-251]
MKDNITLIAAATGGLMLSVALSGILKGAPVANWQNSSISSNQIAHVRIVNKNQ